MNRFLTMLCILCLTIIPAASLFAAGESCDPKSGACSACPAAAACAAEGKTLTAAADEKHAEELPIVNTLALKAMLSAKVPVVVLDARTGKYDDGKRLPGAKALAPTSTAEEAAKLIPAKDAFVVTYCAGPKCPASNALYQNLKKLGYTNVAEYPEGIEGWLKGGNEVTTAK